MNRSTDTLRRATAAIESWVESELAALRFGCEMRGGNRHASFALLVG